MTEPELLIYPAELTYPAAADHVPPPRGRTAYQYTAERFDRLPGSLLFWGPYLDLKAGVYVLNFIGEVEGRLSLEFTYDSGRMRIKRIELGEFAAPVCIVLVRAARAFEIRALKTPALDRLRLDGIRLQRVYPGEERP